MSQFLLGLLEAIHSASMSYVAAKYFILVAFSVVIYYIWPKATRWLVLLVASAYFYYEISTDPRQLLIFGASIIISFVAGLLIKRLQTNKMLLCLGIILSIFPLLFSKCNAFFSGSSMSQTTLAWIIPMGLSFYSMQIIAYLVDIYRGKIEPQPNLLKYTLFISFFPIIIQGPISRYDQLAEQLYEGHSYNTQKLMRGIQLILWGLFLKYLIADKSAVVVNAVFDNYESYSGFYIFIAAILYSIQLYTDFLSCVTMSQGVAGLFGIELMDNFNHPYFSTSIKEFWRRWHISLSGWLRDYVYIPLGGNRKGTLHKYLNLIITFAVSGIWHGSSWKYLFWGLMHAGYQIVGDFVSKPKNMILEKLSLPKDSITRKILEMLTTSFLVMLAWIIFRAESLRAGIAMIISMFRSFNPWILFDNSLFRLGLNQKEFTVLSVSILLLIIVSFLQERGIKIRDWFNKQNTLVRWVIYLGTIWSLWIFGTYGYGFNAADFIYGGF